MGMIDKDFIVESWFFTPCWELIETTRAQRWSSGYAYYVHDSESFDAAHLVLGYEEQQDILDLQEKLSEAESDPGVGEEYIESLEEQLSELRDSDPREAMQYWVVHKYLADNYGWGEMGISPPVFEWMGLYIWIQTYNSIREDSFIEALCEHIRAGR